MFEEDFFEAEELRLKTKDSIESENAYAFNISKYFRALK